MYQVDRFSSERFVRSRLNISFIEALGSFELAVGAEGGAQEPNLAEGSCFLPTRLAAARLICSARALWAAIHRPAWIELDNGPNTRKVESFIQQAFDKSEAREIFVGVQSMRIPSGRFKQPGALPHS